MTVSLDHVVLIQQWIFSVAKATLQSPLSVCSFICLAVRKQSPSNSFKSPSSHLHYTFITTFTNTFIAAFNPTFILNFKLKIDNTGKHWTMWILTFPLNFHTNQLFFYVFANIIILYNVKCSMIWIQFAILQNKTRLQSV